MNFLERLDNIYVIDTKMFGFDHYCAAYLVEGEEIALIDTGMPSQLEAVRAGIKAHGFSVSDISYIFLTHCEHPDHSGNTATFLKESPGSKVYIHPAGLEYLTRPEEERARRKQRMPVAMAERFGDMEPVPLSRIKLLNDGDVFDLGKGETLKIIFAPGHQPSGVAILEGKNMGLFISDMVGNCFADADAHYPLNPLLSDHKQAIESLEKLMGLPVAYLFLGHYGISDKPQQVMARAVDLMHQLLDIGTRYVNEGHPECIAEAVWEVMMPELEKLRSARGEAVYRYATREHIPSQLKLFSKYCQDTMKKR